MELEPIEPETAVELFLSDREIDVSESTLRHDQSHLRFFLEWCEREDIQNLNELNGRLIQQHRIWRRNDADLAPPSEKNHMDTLRVFIRWLGTIDGVAPDLHHKVRSPKYSKGKHSRDAMIDPETAEAILTHLGMFEYASRDHIVISLVWHTMLRRGSIRALDVEDYDPEDRFLSLIHRPETGTPLKNKQGGQRLVALSDDVATALDHYLSVNRNDVKDEHGREPLITTSQGRIAASTLGKTCYKWSRPCKFGQSCPHGRNTAECSAAIRGSKSSTCPSSESSHAFRRGGITHYLSQSVPQDVVSERADVSADVLEAHYDERSEKGKMEQRREYLDQM